MPVTPEAWEGVGLSHFVPLIPEGKRLVWHPGYDLARPTFFPIDHYPCIAIKLSHDDVPSKELVVSVVKQAAYLAIAELLDGKRVFAVALYPAPTVTRVLVEPSLVHMLPASKPKANSTVFDLYSNKDLRVYGYGLKSKPGVIATPRWDWVDDDGEDDEDYTYV